MLKALIVDDEPLAHKVILHHLAQHSDIEVIGQCYSAMEVVPLLSNQSLDLLFLDINMPQLTGIELLSLLAKPPHVIIVSAYQEYALQGFELNVTDYLLKPVSATRFASALDKVRNKFQLSYDKQVSHVVLKVDREKRKFEISSICLLEAYGNYVKVWQGDAATLVNSTLKSLLKSLPEQSFKQVHKSFAVNLHKVSACSSESIRLDNGRNIKIGKSYKTVIQSIL